MTRPGGPLLVVIDTATRTAVLALGRPDGSLVGTVAWTAGHRHGEELLARLDSLLDDATGGRAALARVAGIIVGTGPGAFTGLRVGIATAKALAVGLGVPIAGVPTGTALLAAAGLPDGALLLPAGPTDRYLVTSGRALLVPAGTEPPYAPSIEPGGPVGPMPEAWATLEARPTSDAWPMLVAVDLADRAPAPALARGVAAVGGLAAVLARLGASRLAAGDLDDAATLAPEYVTLPRGVAAAAGEVTWSPARP